MNRVTIRLRELAGPAAERAQQLGKSLITYIRDLIAADLGIDPPAKHLGNMQIAEHAEAGARARWGSHYGDESDAPLHSDNPASSPTDNLPG